VNESKHAVTSRADVRDRLAWNREIMPQPMMPKPIVMEKPQWC
jgi:hypothetical protein